MKIQLNFLKLVYPPISNQEGEWLKDEPEVQEVIKQSNLYMIAQRHESKFIIDEKAVFHDLTNKLSVKFIYSIGNLSTEVIIDFLEILNHNNVNIEKVDLEFEFGEKLIRLWSCKVGSEERINVISWFTTEKLLYDIWRNHPAINVSADIKKFSQYYLHYVGISKKEDSLSRLMIQPHDKRLRILSNESPHAFASRVTDEIILFFFRIEPLRIQEIDSDNNFEELINGACFDNIKIIADAEKAFIKILNCNYNKIKYKQYPKGTDGLYGSGLQRYGYTIAEDITFTTDTETIAGCYVPEGYIADKSDCILIEGDNVELFKLIE